MPSAYPHDDHTPHSSAGNTRGAATPESAVAATGGRLGQVAHALTDAVTRERLGYTGRARTCLREAERVLRATTHPACRHGAIVVPTFWWEKVKNFGDLLTPYLLRDFGIVPALSPPRQARLVGVGSLIQHLPTDFEGALWGSGLVADERVDLPGATCLALRGELTRDRLGNPRVSALGDPGLLLGAKVRRPGVCFDVGVVPHYVHADDAWLRGLVAQYPGTVRVIDVKQSPRAVARAVASCRTIVSTSLHGVITADSFGIPVTWVRMPRELAGGDFKFADHESVVRPARSRGVEAAEVESLHELVARALPADNAKVQRACADLRSAAMRIEEVVQHRQVRAWQVPRYGRGRPVHNVV
ncbi:polysaccharide pyruvyl transferase family protein [Gephyromycinifex aptenodytis]|uniref:polysaccharide pyruvyl transferase family protein n=1 Tax=Gephyromycinifex aptenodytis TaxID=2716227 RepID=UPI0014468A21|nr:polysaccharide pyruvyl transferase family protein [Gephyromycinifex aptenodytis]